MNALFDPTSEVARTVGLVVNAPAIFARPDFMEWLNRPGNAVFTWHAKGDAAHEYSDVIVLIDADYEGDSSDMPEDIWKAVCDLAYEQYGGPASPLSLGATIHVRLTNLAAD